MMDNMIARFRFLWNHNRNLVLAALAGDIVLVTALVALVWMVS